MAPELVKMAATTTMASGGVESTTEAHTTHFGFLRGWRRYGEGLVVAVVHGRGKGVLQ